MTYNRNTTIMKLCTISFFFVLFAFARAAYEQKKKELLSRCGMDLNRGEFYENTNLNDFPWLALLQYDTPQGELKSMCGGVLISDQYVLTAAHCVDSPTNQLRWVILGEHNTETDPDCVDDGDGELFCNHFARYYGFSKIIIHEGYSSLSLNFDSESKSDLALIKLDRKVEFTDFIQPICLPQKPEMERQSYLVAGWGKSMAPRGDGFTEKLVSRAESLSPAECTRYPINSEYTSEDHICAGKNQRVCVADAGGPLMNYELKSDGVGRMTVFGVSFMDLTCQYRVPGVFTKVYKYLPWIESHIFS